MDRVVNFLSTNQHKVLFLFHNEMRMAQYIMVLSRRKSHIYLLELGHGGIAIDSSFDSQAGGGGGANNSLLMTETSKYNLSSVEVDTIPRTVRSKLEKTCSILVPRFSVWGSDVQGIRLGLFVHPYFIVTDPVGILKKAWKVGDFQWSMESNGCFLVLRLEDFYQNQHTIHEKIDKSIIQLRQFILTSLQEFIQRKTTRKWKLPHEDQLAALFLNKITFLQSTQQDTTRIRKQLTDIYSLLHDVSLETLNVEEHISAVENMVFHQVLSYGQKKRKLHKTLDQLRLLEKHVLELLLSLLFKYDHGYLETLSVLHKIEHHLVECEGVIQSLVKPLKG